MMAVTHRPQRCFFLFSSLWQIYLEISQALASSILAYLIPYLPCPSRDLRAFTACRKTPPPFFSRGAVAAGLRHQREGTSLFLQS